MPTAEVPQIITDENEFLHRVLIDGRYITNFHADPHGVAQALGFEISRDVADKASLQHMDLLLATQSPAQIIGNQSGGKTIPSIEDDENDQVSSPDDDEDDTEEDTSESESDKEDTR